MTTSQIQVGYAIQRLESGVGLGYARDGGTCGLLPTSASWIQ